MGVFNSVCALSELPIYSRNKVKLVIQLTNEPRTTYVDSTTICIPCCLPISGLYDSYGKLEEIKEDYNTALISELFDFASEQGWLLPTEFNNVYQGNESKILAWLEQIQSERFKISPTLDKIKKVEHGVLVSYSLVLEEIWDKYLEVYDPKGIRRGEIQTDMDIWFSWYNEYAPRIMDSDDNNYFLGESWGKQYGSFRNYETNAKSGKKVKPLPDMAFLRLADTGNRTIDTTWFTELYFHRFCKPLMVSGDLADREDPRWVAFRDAVAEMIVISWVMRVRGTCWLPRRSCAQDSKYDFHEKIAKVNHSIASKRFKKYKKENGL